MKFTPDNQRAWLTFLDQNDGKKIVVTAELDKARRSLDQNAWLWGVVYRTIADYTGSTEQELHEIFKRMFLLPKIVKWKDKIIKMPGSTSDLNKPQFGEFVERIRAEVATMGIAIPDPVPNKILPK